jgi:hypothetical protein
MALDDINGAKPKRIMGVIGGLRSYMDMKRSDDQVEVKLRTQKRNIMDITDIEGTKAKKEHLVNYKILF